MVNEAFIIEKLAKVNVLIGPEFKDAIVDILCSKITILKRDYVMNASWKIVDQDFPALQKLKRFFCRDCVFEYLANCDLKLIESIILVQDFDDHREDVTRQDFP